MLARLKKIGEEFNVAILFTNQVMSDPGGGAMFVSDPKKPVGGHVLAHATTTRISIRKGKAEQRVAKVVHSPDMGERGMLVIPTSPLLARLVSSSSSPYLCRMQPRQRRHSSSQRPESQSTRIDTFLWP